MRDPLAYADLRAATSGRVGVADMACPLCGPSCRAVANQRRKVLRVWDDGEGFITFHCARCGERGWARDDNRIERRAEKPRPAPADNDAERNTSKRIEVARWLWTHARPVEASNVVGRYLTSRACLIASPALGYLPARDGYEPAMVARFGDREPITGVHLTRLTPDGRKAGTDRDKIMVGPSSGQPIVIAADDERGELIVTEGIEDACSLALATGWNVWAAGAAGRIPSLLTSAQRFSRVYVAADLDWGKPEKQRAGPRALDRARIVRPDLIPLHFGKLLGRKLDPNAALVQHGPAILTAVIDWSEAHERHARREIGFEEMQRASAHADAMFRALAPSYP